MMIPFVILSVGFLASVYWYNREIARLQKEKRDNKVAFDLVKYRAEFWESQASAWESRCHELTRELEKARAHARESAS